MSDTKFFDAEGKEVEAFTQEQIDAKLAEVSETSKTEMDELREEKARLQVELDTVLKSNDNKDEQVQRHKDKTEEKNSALDDLKSDFAALRDKIEGEEKGTIETQINKLAGGDTDLKKRLEFEFKSYNPEGVNSEERLAKAFTLAGGKGEQPGILDALGNPGTGDRQNRAETQKVESEASKTQRQALGISDADVEKFGKKANS